MHVVKLAGVALLCVAAKPAPVPQEITLVPGQPVSVTVQGIPISVLPQADGFGTLVLNPDSAARLGIKAGIFGGTGKIGPVKLPVSSAVVPYGIGTKETKHRIIWLTRPIAASGDGALGPAAFAHPVVTFRLRPTMSGETVFSFPMSDKGASFGSLGLMIRDQGRDMLVQFDLDRAHSIVSAPTANGLAARHGGAMSGAATRQIIKLGVERPVRRLNLDTPVVIGSLRIKSVFARTSDYGNASGIRSENDDPDEIVVTGNGEHKPQLLRLGREDMAACSRLTFDKPKRIVRLSCRAS